MKINGLRSRVTIGFMGIAGLLFLSGMLSFFELSRLSDDTDIILRTNKRNMELSQEMIHSLQSQNYAFVQIAAFGDRSAEQSCIESVESLEQTILAARGRESQVELLDSMLLVARHIGELSRRLVSTPHIEPDSMMVAIYPYPTILDTQDNNREIYNEYQPLYISILSLVDDYINASQSALAPRAESLRHNAYRAVTPVFISLVVMIVIVLLLYYFMTLYCVNPIIAMNKSLHSFLNYKVPFAPKAECRDEVEELREKIEQLTFAVKKNKA